MKKNLYEEFDNILDLWMQKLASVENGYKKLLENTERNTSEIKYGTASSYLGYFCPSLVLDKITSGFSKGRLLKSMPENKDGKRIIYDIDNNGKLLRIQDINSFGTIVETFIIREGNTEFSVIFLDKKLTASYSSSTRTIYENGKLARFDIIGNSSMWSEIYTYNPNDDKKVECKQYYYVPNLNGSSKSIPLGMKGSPAQLFIMEIDLDSKGKVVKIEHSEFIEEQKILTFTYKK